MSALWARRLTLATLASIGAHVAFLLAVLALNTAPETGFEFQIPVEVELGLSEATEIEPPPAEAVAPPPEDVTGTGEGEGPGAGLDGGVPHDGGGSDSGRRRRRDAGTDAGVPVPSGEGDSTSPVAFLPAGSQVALRIDMDRIRGSELRVDVERLIEVIPDWDAVLGGSGVEPVRDLSRVLIATPDFQRSHIVVAGRLAEGAPPPREVAERMNTSGMPLEWTEEDGIAIADWHGPDLAERRVAILDSTHFVLSRPGDLHRVLAIAAARVRDGEENAADALLSLADGEALSLEVEGVASFVRRSPCVVPSRARLAMTQGEGEVGLHGSAQFATPEDAESARVCLDELRRRAAANLMVSFLDLDGPLRSLELEVDETRLLATTSLRFTQLRRILGFLRDMLRRPPPPPPPPPPVITPTPRDLPPG